VAQGNRSNPTTELFNSLFGCTIIWDAISGYVRAAIDWRTPMVGNSPSSEFFGGHQDGQRFVPDARLKVVCYWITIMIAEPDDDDAIT
jgi:hypothetical protein